MRQQVQGSHPCLFCFNKKNSTGKCYKFLFPWQAPSNVNQSSYGARCAQILPATLMPSVAADANLTQTADI